MEGKTSGESISLMTVCFVPDNVDCKDRWGKCWSAKSYRAAGGDNQLPSPEPRCCSDGRHLAATDVWGPDVFCPARCSEGNGDMTQIFLGLKTSDSKGF